MEAHIHLKCHNFLIIFLMGLLILHRIEAVEYIVGNDEGWTTSVNYQQWSNKYNFFVGDVLVFKYVVGQHNTYEVIRETYSTCDTREGVIETYYSGQDRVTLMEAKTYWFLCNIEGHCLAGMRFQVQVKASNASALTQDSIGAGSVPTSSKTTKGVGPWETRFLVALVSMFLFLY